MTRQASMNKTNITDQIVRTQVRIPEDLMEWMKRRAREQNRSMNAQLVAYLRQVQAGERVAKNEEAPGALTPEASDVNTLERDHKDEC